MRWRGENLFFCAVRKKKLCVDSKFHVEFGRRELLGPPFNLDSKFERAQNLLREIGRCVWSEGIESGSFASRSLARGSNCGSVSLPADLPVEKKSVLGRGPITAIFINLRRQESRRVATFKTQFGAAWRRREGDRRRFLGRFCQHEDR